MKVVVFFQNGTYFAEVIEENGDEHELTRSNDREDLLEQIQNMAPDAPIEFHEDVPEGN